LWRGQLKKDTGDFKSAQTRLMMLPEKRGARIERQPYPYYQGGPPLHANCVGRCKDPETRHGNAEGTRQPARPKVWIKVIGGWNEYQLRKEAATLEEIMKPFRISRIHYLPVRQGIFEQKGIEVLKYTRIPSMMAAS